MKPWEVERLRRLREEQRPRPWEPEPLPVSPPPAMPLQDGIATPEQEPSHVIIIEM